MLITFELNRFAVGAATNSSMDNDQHICQLGAGFRLCLVAARPTGSSCNLLSHSHMDTLHCSSDVAGSAAQFNCSVSAMPWNRSGTVRSLRGQGMADTLLLR